METATSLPLGDTSANCEIQCPEIHVEVYKGPLEKLHTPPYNNYDEQTRSNNPELMSTILAEARVAFQNGLNYQEPSIENKIQNIILAPFKYIESLPSKGVRNILIDALGVWFKVPEESMTVIRDVVALLHTSSLMFDDIEDDSSLRRGKPATHKIFGIAQTINSSTHVLMSSITKSLSLSNKDCVHILVDGVSRMLEGQGMDLHSTYLMECPQEEEYLQMVDRKTGALFRIAYHLMRAEASEVLIPNLDNLMTILGRYFQIRDDYMNLMSHEYTGQKGFCEDLDEGKFSFPLIHCLGGTMATSTCTPYALELKNILATRCRVDRCGLPPELKLHILDILSRAGSLAFTKFALDQLESDLRMELERVETVAGSSNPILRGLMKKMKI